MAPGRRGLCAGGESDAASCSGPAPRARPPQPLRRPVQAAGRRFQKVRRRLGGAGGVGPRGSASPRGARVGAGASGRSGSRRAHRAGACSFGSCSLKGAPKRNSK